MRNGRELGSSYAGTDWVRYGDISLTIREITSGPKSLLTVGLRNNDGRSPRSLASFRYARSTLRIPRTTLRRRNTKRQAKDLLLLADLKTITALD
jgi:hypothetical protein